MGGLSHGLKTCHRHVFFTAFRVHQAPKKRAAMLLSFFGARDGTRLHLCYAQIKVRLRPAVGGGAHPHRI